jgi:hypothetical protein
MLNEIADRNMNIENLKNELVSKKNGLNNLITNLTSEITGYLTKLMADSLDNETLLTVDLRYTYNGLGIILKRGKEDINLRFTTYYKGGYEVSYTLTNLNENTPLMFAYISLLAKLSEALKTKNDVYEFLTSKHKEFVRAESVVSRLEYDVKSAEQSVINQFRSEMANKIKNTMSVGDTYVIIERDRYNRTIEKDYKIEAIKPKTISVTVNGWGNKRLKINELLYMILDNTSERSRKMATATGDANFFKKI